MANNGVHAIPRQATGSLESAPAGYVEVLINDSTGKLATVDEAGLVTNYGLSAFEEGFALFGGRNALTVTDVYLRGSGNVPTNQAGFVLPYNATIIGISVATQAAASWTAEVRKNGLATVIAQLVISSAAKAKTIALDVDVDADDEIQLYCNGTAVPYPTMVVWFKRR